LTKEELRHAAMRELKVSKNSFDFGEMKSDVHCTMVGRP
jgi:hypothetical protein